MDEMEKNNKCHERQKGHIYFQWTFALLVSISVVVFGVEVGWISPITKYIESDASPTGYPVSGDALGWIASSMSLAAIFGVPLTSFFADTWGRKASMICTLAVPQAVSWIIRASYTSVTTLIIARSISGLACGGSFIVVPMYIKEISQDDMRGILGTLPTLFQTLGVLFVYLIGNYLDYFTVIYIMLALPIIAIIMILLSPESPAFLVKKGRFDDAIAAIAFLRGLEKDDKTVHNVIEDMKEEEAYFNSLPNISLLTTLKEKGWRKGFILMTIIITLTEMSGAYAIVTYASTILSSTATKFEISPEIQSLSFPIVMIVGSLVVTFLIEKVGRKPLLFLSFLITALSMFAMAILIILQLEGYTAPTWLPVLMMMLCVAMYNGGIVPIGIIMMTEIFSFQIRAKFMGAITTYAWFIAFWLVTIYPLMANNIGKYSPFILFGLLNLIGAIFALVCLPETKGKSEMEIAKFLEGKAKDDTTNEPWQNNDVIEDSDIIKAGVSENCEHHI